MRERTDRELVQKARDGDRAAFATLLDRHESAVRAVARRLLGGNDAEDVVQEAFLQGYLGLDRLRDPARFGAWLTAIGVNLARMQLRARRTVPLGEAAAEELPGEQLEIVELVRSAVAVLPERERQAVLLYYVEGLSSPEVASALGEPPGTVRVRLHRARRRLRERLSELAPKQTKEATMVEVELQDVVVRMTESDELADEKLRIVLLKEKGGQRILPIWIGAAEGDALALQLGGEAMPRPLTADLMARLLDAAGASVRQVAVNSLREGTFFASVVLESGKEVDSRPSDALNLAARVGAPILVDDAVMESSFTGNRNEHLKEEEARLGVEPGRPGEWRSLSPELVKQLHPTPPFK